jgi:hypothetical protein
MLTICVEPFRALPLSYNLITLAAGAAGLTPTAKMTVADWRGPGAAHLRRILMPGTIVASLVNNRSYSMLQAGS